MQKPAMCVITPCACNMRKLSHQIYLSTATNHTDQCTMCKYVGQHVTTTSSFQNIT